MYFFRNAVFAALTVVLCACAAPKTAVTAGADPSSAAAASAKSAEADAAKLGAPIYPSSVSAGAGGTATTPDGTMAAFTTHDSFAKVYAFYKTHMPANSQTAKALGGGSSVAAFRLVDESAREHTTVTISEKTGHTDILIMHGTVKDAASPEPAE